MRTGSVSVAWYRFRVTLHRRWRGYISLVVLIGLVGGVAMAGLAAARRTQSSFATYLASTNPSQMGVSVYATPGLPGAGNVNVADVTRSFERLRYVRAVRAGLVINGFALAASGATHFSTVGQIYPIASPDGLFFTQDRVTVTQGRMADPTKADEVMLPNVAAQLLGVHVGQFVRFGIFTNAQEHLPDFGSPQVAPKLTLQAKLVGLVSLSSAIVQDDIDHLPTFAVFTPALADEILRHGPGSLSTAVTYSLQLDGGYAHVGAVEQEITRLLPGDETFGVHDVAPVAAKADRAIKPIAIALGVFGAIALLAALLIASQAIARRLRSGSDESNVLRSLGADPVAIVADGLIGILCAVMLGSVLAALVAIALSPLAPLVPVRPVYPTRGVSADWVVLGFGLVVLIGGLSAVALGVAVLGAPHRIARRNRLTRPAVSKVAQACANLGFPTPGVVGVRMALEPGSGRTAVPVRSALVGMALAVALVVSTVSFGSSLRTLVNRPALYGWNWTYMLNQNGAGSAGVPPQTLTALAHDPDVAAAAGANYNDVTIDGQNVPVIFQVNNAPVTPPILSGHGVERTGQIVLGAWTLAQLHKHVGDSVTVSYDTSGQTLIPATRLRIVGTATLPAVGFASLVSDHTSMGTGGLVSFRVVPAAAQAALNTPYRTLNGPNLVFVRLRAGVSARAGLADMDRIAAAAIKLFVTVQVP